MVDHGKKFKTPISSIFMYIIAAFIGLIGIALLVDNVRLFNINVAQYVAQGYTAVEVKKQLIPGQLLPGIFEPVALYGGIAFILFCAGIINKKISNLLKVSVPDEAIDNVIESDAITGVVGISEAEAEVEIAEQIAKIDNVIEGEIITQVEGNAEAEVKAEIAEQIAEAAPTDEN